MSQHVLERLQQQFPSAVLETHNFRGDETALIERAALVELCGWLKTQPDLQLNMLVDMTAVDYLPRHPRFEVVYHLHSLPLQHRVRLKVRVPEEDTVVDSLCPLWPIANWLEREIWDLYGIRFHGHPQLRRILLYEDFVGHPLRKDYAKEQRQPLVRRAEEEIAEALSTRAAVREAR